MPSGLQYKQKYHDYLEYKAHQVNKVDENWNIDLNYKSSSWFRTEDTCLMIIMNL